MEGCTAEQVLQSLGTGFAVLAVRPQVIKAIGYDDGPSDGRRIKDFRDPKYRFWYPLREFGLDRSACIDLILSEGLIVPCKSACFFCPATKKPELIQLQRQHPDLVGRALAIEERALPKLRSVKGLGRSFSWTTWLHLQAVAEATT